MDLYKVDAENRIYAQQQRHHHPLFEADKKLYTVYIMGFFMVDKHKVCVSSLTYMKQKSKYCFFIVINVEMKP